MKAIKLLVCLFAVIGFSSCEKVIEAKDLPEQDARIVLNSILNSGDFISANVTASKSILKNKAFKNLDNAICQVFENDAYIGDLTNIQNGDFTSFFTAKINKRYRLVVSASGYSTATAITTIPPSVKFTKPERYDTINYNYRINQYSSTTKSLGGSSRFKLKILDDAATKNFYSLRPIVILQDSAGNSIDSVSYVSIINNSTSNSVGGQADYGGYSLEIDDLTTVNNNEILLDFDVSFNYDLANNVKIKSIRVYLEISNLSEEYYKYKVTSEKQAYAGVSLFAEPVLVYSNVTNGLGILGAAGITKVLIY
jgi:hypothetical protein